MRRWFYFLLFFVLFGCASHYHEISGENLHLYLKLEDVSRVGFASSLDGFKVHEAKQADLKTWEISVPAGQGFGYFYFVDGKIYIPDCRMREYDDFGMQNCLYEPGL